jgi:hypothetical protein
MRINGFIGTSARNWDAIARQLVPVRWIVGWVERSETHQPHAM